ncbi:Amuc_1101 family PilM-like pilus complex protein [Haloferula sp.]|uniref:Amuc_1101 family PilM-like pilus complex protein n=1 Tax=Haloferula sp. TaxID=2497595 RepID=UPI003C711812
MADNQSTVALNIGTQRISMAVFEPSKSGGLVLKSYDAESVLADPASESTRASHIRQAIADLAGRLKAKGKVRYTISGQAVFIRFVKLPPLDDDNIEQLVTFEAQQHVPFPLEEVVWDYEILESGGEKEVVIVAIKGDALEDINDSVNATGLGTAEVDVAPMALYNSFRAAYPDVTDPVLLIDVGAKTSDLLYIEGDRFFTRSAATGGATVTAAIAKEFNVPFAEAEAHKTQNGLVALGGGHTESLDESTAALAMCIRNAMTRLATEIPRTTNYYRSQHGGSAPKHVFLAGGGANLPYAKEFFEEKLKLPVDYFNPLPAISIGKGVDTDRLSKEAHTMGELVGLGLRGIGKSKLNIDLVPSKVGQARESEKRKPFLIAAAALLVLGTGAWGFFQMSAASSANEKKEDMERQADSLRGPAGKLNQLGKQEDQLRNIANEYIQIEKQRTFWLDALQELKASFASDAAWIVDYEPLANYNPTNEQAPGKTIVKPDFARIAFGNSALENIGGGNPNNPVKKVANAVRIKGFWRDNPRKSNVVYDLLNKLRENAGANSHYRFTVEREGKQVPLEDKQLVPRLDAAPEEGQFAASFEIILPLSTEVPFE